MLVRNATYIQVSTARLNARYFVSWCQRKALEDTALVVCKRQVEKLRQTEQKRVVYCLSKAQCKQIAKKVSYAYYYANVEKREERLQEQVEQRGLIVATSALRIEVNYLEIVYILHVEMPQSIMDFAQASRRRERGRETFNVVVIVEQRKVEKRTEQESGDINVQVIGAFLIRNRCWRALISSYLDGQGIGYREIDRVCCNRCREGEELQLEEHENQAREQAVVEEKFTELRGRCAIYQVVRQQYVTKEEKQQKKHQVLGCTAQERASSTDVDTFWKKIVDRTVKNNCRRCQVSQKYCATGEGIENWC